METNAIIGLKIKNLRNEKKYTLKYISEQTNLSIGFLSQLERGMTSVAVDSLAKIAKVLDVELSSFFDPSQNGTDTHVVRSYERKTTVVNPQIIEHALTHHMNDFDMLPRLIEVMPAHPDKSPLELYSHGGEEFIYVLEGILTMQIEDDVYELYPGDSIHIHSDMSHNWRNETNNVIRMITVHSPNPFK